MAPRPQNLKTSLGLENSRWLIHRAGKLDLAISAIDPLIDLSTGLLECPPKHRYRHKQARRSCRSINTMSFSIQKSHGSLHIWPCRSSHFSVGKATTGHNYQDPWQLGTILETTFRILSKSLNVIVVEKYSLPSTWHIVVLGITVVMPFS